MIKRCVFILHIFVGITLIADNTNGSVVEFWNDEAGWQDAVASFNTIDFTGLPNGTTVSNQYSDLGLTFTNFVFIQEGPFWSDGFGLFGEDGIRLTFDMPQHAFAVNHLAVARFDLYLDGHIVATTDGFSYPGVPGPLYFSGIVSDIAFDEIYIYKPNPPFDNNIISLDTLYWGTVPSPGTLPVLAFALLTSRRRRRSA